MSPPQDYRKTIFTLPNVLLVLHFKGQQYMLILIQQFSQSTSILFVFPLTLSLFLSNQQLEVNFPKNSRQGIHKKAIKKKPSPISLIITHNHIGISRYHNNLNLKILNASKVNSPMMFQQDKGNKCRCTSILYCEILNYSDLILTSDTYYLKFNMLELEVQLQKNFECL